MAEEQVRVTLNLTLQNERALENLRRHIADIKREAEIPVTITPAARPFPAPPGGGLGRGDFPGIPSDPNSPLRRAVAALRTEHAGETEAARMTRMARGRENIAALQRLTLMAGLESGQLQPGPQRATPLQAAWTAERGVASTIAGLQHQQRAAATHAQLSQLQLATIAGGIATGQIPNPMAPQGPWSPLSHRPVGPWSAWTPPATRPGFVPGPMTTAPMHTVAPAPGWTAPSGPFSNWPGSFWQRAPYMMGNMLTAGGGMAQQAAGGLLGAIQRPARAVLGAAAGFGIYQTLTESMDLYRQRAQGIIDVGMRLDLNFTRVGATIDTLRTKYQVLAHDSIAAQLALARIGGNPALLDPAVRAGAAYGVAAPQAAALAGTLSRLTVPGASPLSTIAALGTRLTSGIAPMGMEEIWEETARIAGFGGTARPRVDVAMPARWMGMITGMGERYNVPGAASDFFGRFAAGVNQAPDATTQALRVRALRDLAKRHGPMLKIGDEDVDLRTITGLRIAMENAIDSPQILEQYRQTATELFGANPEQNELGFQALVGTGLNLTESRRFRRTLATTGGFRPLGRTGMVGVGATQEEEELQRLEARRADPNYQFLLRQAQIEPRLERMGEPLVKASTELKDSLTRLTDMMIEGTLSWKGLTEAVQASSGETKALVGALVLLSSSSYLGQALGLGMMAGGGIQAGNLVEGGVQTPYGRFQLLPKGMFPSLDATKPGP